MTNYTIEYQNPCEKDPSIETLCRETEIVAKFQTIDWFQHALDVVYSHNAPDEGVEYNEAIHDYYYFSIEYKNYEQQTHTLNIVAGITSGYVESKTDILFDIEYRRPELVATSKFSQLFGKPKEKINPEYMSHGVKFSTEETIRIISNFIQDETAVLDSVLDIQGYLY